MLAIGEGAKQRVIDQIGSMGTNLLVIRPQFRTCARRRGAAATLTTPTPRPIARGALCDAAMPDVTGSATVRYGASTISRRT